MPETATAASASSIPTQVARDGIGQASWQQELRGAIREPEALCELLGLPEEIAEEARRAAGDFPPFAPHPYLNQIERGNPHDPLLRQILPLDAEQAPAAGFDADPVGDLAALRAPGLLQKYHGRALLITTGACAVHCRYCFRRHFPYSDSQSPRSAVAWQPAIDAIAADPSLREVILSGGDPLVLVDSLLADLADRLAAIPHLSRLRIHTRLPIMIPQRIDDALVDWLSGTRLAPITVIHANHPNELRGPAAAAVGRLVDAGIPVLNQSVLLRGVNDDADVLAELCERLVNLRAMPYYLHQLDRVAGAAHFEVAIEEGLRLMAELLRRLPGYAVPRYVREVASEPFKIPLDDSLAIDQ